MKKILLLTMGGTIDAQAYPEEDGQYPENATLYGSNASFETLSELLKAHNWSLDKATICDKDSKEYNDEDRQKLLLHVLDNHSKYHRIIVTSGTDKMVETAQWLKQTLEGEGVSCPVVFTGAIWPLANGLDKSDGFKNLERAALYAERSLINEVFVTVGNIFMFAEHVQKNFETKKFVLKT